ncbi:autotransporter-associated beta strand repeat-containing protein, partial [bacterium]|nr:autotransporter-associated beta strand repeat-containing protein [bacterium]
TQTIDMDAAQSLLGLSFNSPGTVLIQAGGEEQILTVAAGGISKTGSGRVTIGSTTGGQQVSLQLGADQSWTNHDATSALDILNSVSPSFATERTLTLDGTSTGANTIAGVVSDNGVGVMTLNKTGTGTWILSGENSYTGGTTISAGKLRINGSTPSESNFLVTTGGSLNGSGTVGGNTLINSGGALAPGNSAGVLTISGNTHFESGSIFEWEIDTAQDNPETNRGIAYDGVNTTSLSGSGAIFKIMLTGTQDFTQPFWTQTHIWTDIFKSAAGQSNLAEWSSVFSGGFQYAYNGQTVAPTSTGSFSVTGNSLTWSAVPEPSNLLVGLLAAGALLGRRRQD